MSRFGQRPDLQRTFSEISPDQTEERDLLRYLRRRGEHRQDWSWLLRARIAVVLNEAGAGKTAELIDQAARMDSDRPGFFLRIERLCSRALADSFENESDLQRFGNWRRSRTECVIFLDAIDEAKLPQTLDSNPLHAALRNLERGLGDAFRRVRLVISSRPSAWSPQLEWAEVRRLAERFQRHGVLATKEEPLDRYVHMDELNGEQRDLLARHAAAPPSFMPAFHAAGARDFAHTPLDFLDLIEAFTDEVEAGRPGEAVFESLSQLVDRSIDRRCRDHGSRTPRNLMAPERTRAGARRLAAACVLGQTLTISLPGIAGDGLDPFTALAGSPTPWSRSEVDQLLGSGLFTAAWQGVVRFHHRRTMERLAAEAFDELLRAGYDSKALADLLIPSAFGRFVAPAAYVETTGWISTLNADFRRHVLDRVPQLLIDMGDPGRTPVTQRLEALRRHVARFDGGLWRGEYYEDTMVRRFLAPEMGHTVTELLVTADADEPRRLLLQIAELGPFSETREKVLAIIEDESASPELRGAAIRTLWTIGGPEDFARSRLAALRYRPEITTDAHDIQARNRLRLIWASHSERGMSLADTLAILSRLERHPKSYVPSSQDGLAEAVVARCPANQLPWLLKWLSRLSWASSKRVFASYDTPKWTSVGGHLLPLLQVVAGRILNERPDLHEDPDLVAEIDRIVSVRDVGGGPLYDFDEPKPRDALLEAMRGAPRLRRAIFHTAAALPVKTRSDEPHFVLDRFGRRQGLYGADADVVADLGWMIEDYENAPPGALAQALGTAAAWRLDVVPRRSRSRPRARLIAAATRRNDKDTLAAIRSMRPRFIRPLIWKAERFLRRQTWTRRYERARLWRDLRWTVDLHLHREKVNRGEFSGLIWNMLLFQNSDENALASARTAWGETAAASLARGAIAYARAFDPTSEGYTSANRLAAWGWTQLATEDPDAIAKLTEDEARRALKVMLTQNNWPVWATTLAQRHPSLWRSLLLPDLLREISRRDDGQMYYPSALGTAARQPNDLRALFASDALEALETSRAPEVRTLEYSAELIGGQAPLVVRFSKLCSRRFYEHMLEGHPAFAAPWFSIWLEIDAQAAWFAFKHLYGDPSNAGLIRTLLLNLGEDPPFVQVEPSQLGEASLAYMRLIPIGPEDDGPYGSQRQQAERVRGNLPTLIGGHPTQAAKDVLDYLASQPEFAGHRAWLERVRERQATAAIHPAPYAATWVASFFAKYLAPPRTAEELMTFVQHQIEAVLDDLEHSEFDRRGLFRDAQERDVRAFLGNELRRRAGDWFSVTQEPVTAGENRMDLRIEGRPAHDEVVIIELKIANSSWTGDQLIGHLSRQLVDQYLISRRVRHGIYLVLDLGLRRSWPMADGAELTFEQLVARLRSESTEILASNPTVEGLSVIGRTIRTPARTRRKSSPATI